MARIPAKCPKCGRTKAWQEEVNAFRSGIPAGPLGRVRIGVPEEYELDCSADPPEQSGGFSHSDIPICNS